MSQAKIELVESRTFGFEICKKCGKSIEKGSKAYYSVENGKAKWVCPPCESKENK